jgi:hypothetical protein
VELISNDGTRNLRHNSTPGSHWAVIVNAKYLGRVLDKAGKELRAQSLKISQFHALIERGHTDCRLRDGGNSDKKGWQRSTHGVWIDGRRLRRGGSNSIFFQVKNIEKDLLGDYNDGVLITVLN